MPASFETRLVNPAIDYDARLCRAFCVWLIDYAIKVVRASHTAQWLTNDLFTACNYRLPWS